MISVKRLTHLMILRPKHLRIWTQPTQFQNLNEIFKIDFPGNWMKISIPLESAWWTESVPILWKEKNAYTKKLFRVLIPEFSLPIFSNLFRIKITNNNEIVLNSEFLDAKLFNEMQAQSARCRIIRFMSNRDYLGCKTNYQWD